MSLNIAKKIIIKKVGIIVLAKVTVLRFKKIFSFRGPKYCQEESKILEKKTHYIFHILSQPSTPTVFLIQTV